MIPLLTTNNVSITTATIEIQTIRLDKRQITAAVFRQFPERSPISEDGRLIEGAVPWGIVRYFWEVRVDWRTKISQADMGPDPIHLLWQFEDRLYRAVLYSSASHTKLQSGERTYHNETYPMLAGLEQLFIAA